MNIHKSFTVWALIFGSILCFLIPPFQSPDEPNHFLRAYQISEGSFWPEKTEDMRLGGTLPKNLDTIATIFSYLRDGSFYSSCLNPDVVQHLDWPILEKEKTSFIDFPNTAIYAPTAYIPQSLALFLGKNANLSPLKLMYISRLANLFLWIWIVAAAINLLTHGRRILSYLALLPASLVIAASCNADVITNALCFWVFAFFISKNQGKQEGKAFFSLSNLRVTGALLIIAVNKIVFAPFALLTFFVFIKKEIKIQTKQLYAPLFLCFFIASAAIFWAKSASTLFIPFDSYHTEYRNAQTLNEGVDPPAQLDYILSDPLRFLKTTSTSFRKAIPSTSAHIVGKFGWEKNYLPTWIIGLLWLGLFLLIFFEKTVLVIRQRLLLISIAFLCILLFSITMYCLWVPVGSPILTNLQGRYFVPILPLLCFAFSIKKEPISLKNKGKWLDLALFSTILLGNLCMLLAVYERYWC